MRRIVFICMLLCMLVGVANGQVTRAWIKRTVVQGSTNNTLIATQTFRPQFGGEVIYTLSSVTFEDGSVGFQVFRRTSSGAESWNRIVTRDTGRHRVYAKALGIDGEGNVVVLAELKDKADFDAIVYRFSAGGSAGPTTLIADMWVDGNFQLHPADERAVGLAVRSNGEAVVLNSEFGNPNLGTFARLRQIDADGNINWSSFFRSNLDIQYQPPINVPVALALDASGNAVILAKTARIVRINANTVVDTHENMSVARFRSDGTFINEVPFGLAINTAGGPVELDDVPVALSVDTAGNANIVGTALIDPSLGLSAFPFQVQETVQIGQFNMNWFAAHVQVDQFGRAGFFLPRAITTRADGTVVTIGAEQGFDAPMIASVRGYSGGGLVFNRKGEQGYYNAITTDANNNMYVTGARQEKVGKSTIEQTGTTVMYGTTGQHIWTWNQSSFVDKAGTQGVSIHVNPALDVYVGMTERWNNTTVNKVYDQAAAFKLVQDPKVISMSVTPAAVVGGDTFAVKVTLDKKAPSGGFKINVTADHSSVVVPADLVVPGNRSEATFTFSTVAVGQQRNVTLTAQPGGAQTSITVKTGWLTTLTLSSNSVQGGTSLVGTIKLNSPAPAGGARVSVTSTSTNVTLPLNGVVNIPQGQTTATFPIGTKAVGAITETFVAITYNSTARQQLMLNPPQVTSITAPATVNSGGYGDVTVVLSGVAPANGLPVQIVSDSEALAGMTVIIPATKSSLKFRMNASAVGVDVLVGLQAKTSIETVKTNVTVLAPKLFSVTVSPTDVTGGMNSSFSVKLDGIAPAGGTVVTLSSSNSTAVTVPATMTVLGGKNTGKITLRTTAVSVPTQVVITAKLNGVTKTGTLTINPGN